MRLGWKVFIPITIVWVFVAGCIKYFGWFPLGAGARAMNRISHYFKSLFLIELFGRASR